MKWDQFEPNKDEFNTYNIDRFFEWLDQNSMGRRGHCLFWSRLILVEAIFKM